VTVVCIGVVVLFSLPDLPK